MATYSYTKYIDDDRLALEIRNSAITIALDSVEITGEETVDIAFKANLPEGDKALLDYLVETHINQPITVRDSVVLENVDITSNVERAIKMAPTKLEGSSTLKVSHDFCDKTTWYTGSIRIENEILITQDSLTYTALHDFWIDLEHGKVPYEDRVSAEYVPVVKVNGEIVTEGFVIDYANGEVIFSQDMSGSEITASYSYANESTWNIAPDSNKILKILGTTLKFTNDILLGEGQYIMFQLFVMGNPYGEPTIYKNIKDIVKCTMASPTTIQGFGDITSEVTFLPFDYITSKDLKSSLNMEIRIWLSNHNPCSGEFGIVTANCLSINE